MKDAQIDFDQFPISPDCRKITRRRLLANTLLLPPVLALNAACSSEAPKSSPRFALPTQIPTRTPEPKLPNIAAELQKVQLSSIGVKPEVKQAFEAVTNTYSGTPNVILQRLRVVAFSPTTTEQIKTGAQKGSIFISAQHNAVLAEYAHLDAWTQTPYQTRLALLEAYANASIKALSENYSTNAPLAVALEAGHMSSAPKDKIKQINADRAKRNIPPISETQDTGTNARTLAGATIYEREVNFYLAQLIALKIITTRPNWFAILNAKTESGFPVERFNDPTDADRYYIRHSDSLVSLRFKWERLAEYLAKQGVPMMRFAIHFDSINSPGFKESSIIPQNDLYKDPSTKFATDLARSLQEEVRVITPSYISRVRPDLNSDPTLPYWMIDDYGGDKREDVAAGNLAAVKGVTNLMIAKIRADFIKSQSVPSSGPN